MNSEKYTLLWGLLELQVLLKIANINWDIILSEA